jgi:uncharacterized membrane protein
MEDKFSRYFKRFYIIIFLIVFLLYSLIPFMAPVLMHYGFEIPAKIIYWGYHFLCHQLPYRSFFLYGEQSFYPLAYAGMDDSIVTFEAAVSSTESNLSDIKYFIGNETMGYKIAICQRDLAIYLAIALFCIIFFLTNYRLPRIHWLIWIVLGIIPMALDGLSQMISGMFPTFLSVRESTPFLRVITGSAFGFFTAWFLFPYLEKTLRNQ